MVERVYALRQSSLAVRYLLKLRISYNQALDLTAQQDSYQGGTSPDHRRSE